MNRTSKKVLEFSKILTTPVGRRLLQTCSALHTQNDSLYPLPWPQSLKLITAQTSSFWHRIAGLYLLNQFADFSRPEFLSGVKDAVYYIAEILSDQARHDELEFLLTRKLYRAMQTSLDDLPSDANIHLDIESMRHLQLCTVHGEVGEAPQDDVFAVRILGQDIVSSETNLQTYSDLFFRGSREERLAASDAVLTMKAKFEMGVSFSTREKFIVFDKEGKVIDGSNQFKTCNHFWKFSSPIDPENEYDGQYPLEWTVSDINGYLEQQD